MFNKFIAVTIALAIVFSMSAAAIESIYADDMGQKVQVWSPFQAVGMYNEVTDEMGYEVVGIVQLTANPALACCAALVDAVPHFGCGAWVWEILSDTGRVAQGYGLYVRIRVMQQVCHQGCERGAVYASITHS
jgi:hypothetical protein